MSSPPNVRSRMKCGTKITPCGDAAWGSVRKKNMRLKSATARGNAEPRKRRTLRTVAPFRRGACAEFAPSARSAARMGLRLFRPVGARKKLKGKFVRADSEKRQVSEAWSHVASPLKKLSLTSFDFAVFLRTSGGEIFRGRLRRRGAGRGRSSRCRRERRSGAGRRTCGKSGSRTYRCC